ncbi:unnamed protein product, partial [Heterotrigona itama]
MDAEDSKNGKKQEIDILRSCDDRASHVILMKKKHIKHLSTTYYSETST